MLERLKREPKEPKVKASKNSLDFILYMGVSNEDIERIIVPKIVDLEINGEYAKTTLKDFILDSKAIDRHPTPARHALDASTEQRRMDSLSRLLSLDTKYTSCVAVTFYNGEIIASSNTPNLNERMTESTLSDCFAKKMGLIQDFLCELTKDIPLGSQPKIKKIQFSTRAKLLATKTVLEIMDSSNGGVGDVVPQNNRHKNRGTKINHLQNALLKLGQHCLLGMYTNGKKGFNVQELKTLLEASSMLVITPNTKVLMSQQLHAEQAILYYLREYTDFKIKSSEERVPIGVSKLCCQACHNVLNRKKGISHRGTHGIKFPNVYDIDTKTLFEGINTKMSDNLCPSDSESECEFFSKEEPGFDEEIPDLDMLLAMNESTQPPKEPVKTTGKYRMFQTCGMEEKGTGSTKQSKYEIALF